MDKTTLQALSDLHQARMDDLELMDSIARCLNERIEVLRCLVGFLLENPPSQFSENGDVLEKIKSLVEKDESGKKFKRALNTFQAQRDQTGMLIHDWKKRIDGMSDD